MTDMVTGTETVYTVDLVKSSSYVACPNCGSADDLVEQQIKDTWQGVDGLSVDGSANDYDSFDYADEDIVVGYSCRSCGWSEFTDISAFEVARIEVFVADVLASMPRVKR